MANPQLVGGTDWSWSQHTSYMESWKVWPCSKAGLLRANLMRSCLRSGVCMHGAWAFGHARSQAGPPAVGHNTPILHIYPHMQVCMQCRHILCCATAAGMPNCQWCNGMWGATHCAPPPCTILKARPALKRALRRCVPSFCLSLFFCIAYAAKP